MLPCLLFRWRTPPPPCVPLDSRLHRTLAVGVGWCTSCPRPVRGRGEATGFTNSICPVGVDKGHYLGKSFSSHALFFHSIRYLVCPLTWSSTAPFVIVDPLFAFYPFAIVLFAGHHLDFSWACFTSFHAVPLYRPAEWLGTTPPCNVQLLASGQTPPPKPQVLSRNGRSAWQTQKYSLTGWRSSDLSPVPLVQRSALFHCFTTGVLARQCFKAKKRHSTRGRLLGSEKCKSCTKKSSSCVIFFAVNACNCFLR